MIISVFKLCIFCISHHLHVSFLLRVKVNSTNWPSPNIWVFIAQLVEHCSANAEAIGLFPIEVLKILGGANLQLLRLQLPLRRYIPSFKFVFPQFTSSSCFIPFSKCSNICKPEEGWYGEPKYCYEKTKQVVLISFAVVFGLLVLCS